MKRIAFVIMISFALLLVSGTIHAKDSAGYDTALTYYNSGKFKEAIRYLKDYVKKRPESSAYYLIGYALYELGNHDEAVEYFKEAYLIDPVFTPASAKTGCF